MFRFLLRTLSIARMRTFWIVFAFFLASIFLVGTLFFYQNIRSALAYYILEWVDEHRVTLTREGNIFDLLDPSRWGIESQVLEKLWKDPQIEKYRVFRFLDIPVLGDFRIFQFWLSIDIPVFSVADSRMIREGIGISSSMLKYYNLELAGSYAMFPSFESDDLIGKEIDLTFWASKLFTYRDMETYRYSSRIEAIDTDYPGFGVVIDEMKARDIFKQIGQSLPNPYRIVLYTKDIPDKNQLMKQYPWLTLRLDRDIIQRQEEIISNLRYFAFGIGVFFTIILSAFLILILLSYFREKYLILPLITQFRIRLSYEMFLILGEIILILSSTFLITLMTLPTLISYFAWFFGEFLVSHKILFPLVLPTFTEQASFLTLLFLCILIQIFLIFFFLRRNR